MPKAGSGKSTLVKFIVEGLLNADSTLSINDIGYSCFTGKACNVLTQKGLKNVVTLHKLLYDSSPMPDGSFCRTPKASLKYKVIIVDEVSMAPVELMSLLFKYPVYVICCGDPFQLPTVDKKADNHLLDSPHIFLDEIMRQAQESEIIRLSMKIRNHEPVVTTEYNKEVLIFNKKDLSEGMLNWADQIITATNKTRININSTMRKMQNRGKLPEEGDKIICLRNYWDDVNVNGDSLINGMIGTIHFPNEQKVTFPKFLRLDHYSCDCINGYFTDELGHKFNKEFRIDKKLLMTGEKTLTWKDEYNIPVKFKFLVPYEFTYGYAITCHKAQGSQWDKVLVIEENFPFEREEHARWLYTSCTRSSQKLVLIRG